MDVQKKRVGFANLCRSNSTTSAEGEACNDGEDEREGQEQTVNAQSSFRFTILNEIQLLFLVLFYASDLCLDAWVAVRFFKLNHPKDAWFVLFCILMPNLYAGYKSMQWYLRAHDLDPITRPLPWLIRIIFFPVSLLLRYIDTWHLGRSTRAARQNHDRPAERRLVALLLVEGAEVAMLRLFTIFLEDAPVAVLNLTDVIETPPELQKDKMEMVLVVIFKLIFTMSLGVVHFITSTKLAYHAAKSDHLSYLEPQWGGPQVAPESRWDEVAVLTFRAELCIYVWHLCSIGSRLVAYAMFVCAFGLHLWIVVAVRWVGNIVWIKWDSWDISLTNCVAFGGVYLFSFVPTSQKQQFYRVILYNALTLLENLIIAVLFSIKMGDNPYSVGAYAFVFGGNAFSILFMTLYYGALHPKRDNLKLTQWIRDRYWVRSARQPGTA